jgi:methylmalonic aciduria homocystinuria type C protein
MPRVCHGLAVIDDARAALALAGFDLVHAFDAAVVAREPGLACLGAGRGLLVGNTRALWPKFLAALEADAALAADPDPLDRYTERTIDAVFAGQPRWFAHRMLEGAYLPFQRLAVASGFGALAPIQLVVHPIYGPWFALRAVIVVSGEAPLTHPIPLPCRCDAACHAAMTHAVASGDWESWLAVRASCSLGREWHYQPDQARYHYIKDRKILRRMV